MTIKNKCVILLMSLLLLGCSGKDQSDTLGVVDDGLVEVSISVADGVTRTELDPDNAGQVRWCVGDEVALWAEGVEDGSWALDCELFTLRYFSDSYDKAEFSTKIEPLSSDQRYNYTALYPSPESVSGRVASYTLPSEQSGEYDGVLDLRVADMVEGGALDGEGSEDVVLSFRSLVHILEISIPEGYNKLNTEVAQLLVTFPQEMVGTLSYDVSGTESAATLVSNGSATVTLSPTTPISDGDGQSLYLFINPTSGVSGDIIIQGFGIGGEVAREYSIPLDNHTFSAGHITPVYTEIGEEMLSTTITITISENNVGEELSSVNLTAPEGAIFKESGANTYSIPYDGDQVYSASYLTDLYGDKFSGASIGVTYESPQTLIPSDDLSLSGVVENEVNNFTRVVPYVLYEDFGTISTFSKDDNTGVGGTSSNSGDQDVVDLSSYGLTTEGWTATRVGGSEGLAVRICARYESGGSFVTTMSPGRIDSPALSYLKDGAKITVSYSYKGGRYSKYNDWGWENGGDGNTTYSYGTTTTEGGIVGSTDIDVKVGSDVVVEDTAGSNSSSSQNYNNITYSNSYTIGGGSAATRLSWRVMTTFSYEYFWGTNGNFWLYLDNVCVTVAE